jgi:hypothetical protein
MKKEEFIKKVSDSYILVANQFWPVQQFTTTITKPVCR